MTHSGFIRRIEHIWKCVDTDNKCIDTSDLLSHTYISIFSKFDWWILQICFPIQGLANKFEEFISLIYLFIQNLQFTLTLSIFFHFMRILTVVECCVFTNVTGRSDAEWKLARDIPGGKWIDVKKKYIILVMINKNFFNDNKKWIFLHFV